MARVASVVLFLAALALGWLAFTRFDDGEVPPPASPGFRDYERERLQEAQLSAGLGLAAAVALVGAMACHEVARRPQPRGP